jgi:hypothetical protein
MAREARSILKSYGLLDDPESKKAEAMGWSQAAKEVAMEVDEQAEQDRIDSAAADGRVQDAEFREPEDTDT